MSRLDVTLGRLRTAMLASAGSLAVTLASYASLGQSPNLVFILTDDQGNEAIAGPHFSNELACVTPNLDAFASQGRTLTQFRVNPNCSPSRAAMLTGRQALETGVNGVYSPDAPPGDRDLLMLHTSERTVAEMLQDMGYYTILMDKYHCGSRFDLGQHATQQGFDEFHSWETWLPLDDPNQVGDEHVTTMVDLAINAVNNRPDPNQPYALFFWSIDPHLRDPDAGGLRWWAVDPALAPATSGGGQPTNLSRYRQVIEALDTELGRLMESIGVVDSNSAYQDASDTVVFFSTDNGSDGRVTADSGRGKNSMYASGIRTPLFVFGENVPADGAADGRLVSHVDLYDTIGDIIGASDVERGDARRQSVSFADAIGWGQAANATLRTYSISSHGRPLPENARVAIVSDDGYKIIADAGASGLDDMSNDEFYDLVNDPAEQDNLAISGFTVDELNTYYTMRDHLVDFWGTAVSQAYQPESTTIYVTHEDDFYRLIVTVDQGSLLPPPNDKFYALVADPNATNNLVQTGMTSEQEAAYDDMRSAVTSDLMSGNAGPSVNMVDVPATHTLVLSSLNYVKKGPLAVGHVDPETGSHEEFRAFIRFDIAAIDSLLPDGYTIADVVDAQVIVGFKKDSTASDETDTDLIRVFPVTVDWPGKPWNYSALETGWIDTEMGAIDLAPHIIPDPLATISGIPMPPGTPVSFGHSAALMSQVTQWYNQPSTNHGVMLKADIRPGISGDQHVDFLRSAGLRLTLNR